MAFDITTLPRRKRVEQRSIPTEDEKVAALIDFWAFVDLINFHGGSEEFGECHHDLMDWSDNHSRLKELILMPRGHLKSTLKTVADTLFTIYQNPNVRIFVGTATRGLASAFVREIRTYLEDEFLQEHVWNSRPHIEGKLIPLKDKLFRELQDLAQADKKIIWRGDALQVVRTQTMKEPTVTVGSVGVQPTGYHYDVLKLDDVITFDNITPVKKDKVMAWIHDLFNVLDPPYIDEEVEDILKPYGAEKFAITGGRVTVVGTRYDREDWYSEILEQKNTSGYAVYQKNIYANGRNSDEGYLWHERWSNEVEADKRANMTAARFASQYLNEIVVAEDQILGTDKILYLNPDQIVFDERDGFVHISHSTIEKPTKIKLWMCIDPAAATTATSDYTAIIVGGKDEFKRVFVVDFKLGRWKSEQILKEMFILADKWKLRSVVVEAIGGFKHLTEYMRQGFSRYRPLGIVEFRPQGDKVTRISNALEPLFANSLFYCAKMPLLTSAEARDQLNFFPRPTVHDDFPDVIAILAEVSKSIVPRVKRTYQNTINSQYGGIR